MKDHIKHNPKEFKINIEGLSVLIENNYYIFKNFKEIKIKNQESHTFTTSRDNAQKLS